MKTETKELKRQLRERQMIIGALNNKMQDLSIENDELKKKIRGIVGILKYIKSVNNAQMNNVIERLKIKEEE